MLRTAGHGIVVAAVVGALGVAPACRRKGPPPGTTAPAVPMPVPVQQSGPGYRKFSAAEVAAAREAGFPVDFASCQKAAEARTAVWSCGYKRESHIAHDPALRPCAPLVAHDPEEPFGISQCALIFWDQTVKLPATYQDCRDRFVDEPAVIQTRGQELCMVFVSIVDEKLFDECRKMPFNEYKEGYCKYPLAGPNWSPRGRGPLAEEPPQLGGGSHAGHGH